MQEKILSQDVHADGKEQQLLVFTLPPIMTIETAEALAAEFKQLRLAEKTSLTLNAAQVETITTPGVQLIVSLGKTLEAQGGTLTISGQRDPFTHAFRDTGFENLLGKSSGNAAS